MHNMTESSDLREKRTKLWCFLCCLGNGLEMYALTLMVVIATSLLATLSFSLLLAAHYPCLQEVWVVGGKGAPLKRQ
jgi:hypothetical protein